MLAGPRAEALADTPVVVVAGPRRAGKSTLAEHVVADRAGTWITLDDATILDTARADPVGCGQLFAEDVVIRLFV